MAMLVERLKGGVVEERREAREDGRLCSEMVVRPGFELET